MVCINCKAVLEDDSRFCPVCGTRQPEAAPAAPQPEAEATVYVGYDQPAAQPAYEAPVYQQPAYEAPVYQQPVYEAPAAQPAYEAPVYQQPVYEAPAAQPAYEAPAYEQQPMAAPYEAPAYEQPVPPAAPEAPAEGKKKSKGLMFAILGVAVVAIVVILALILGGGKKEVKGVNMASYIKDEEIYTHGLAKKDEDVQLTDRLVDMDEDVEFDVYTGSDLAYTVIVTEDCSTAFYPDRVNEDGMSLYMRNLNKPKADPIKIDSDIRGYMVSEDETKVIYLKGDSFTLYQYNIKKEEKEKVASDVMAVEVSENAEQFIYVNMEGDMYFVAEIGEKEKMDSDVTNIFYVSEDFKTVYYEKDGGLYKMVNAEDKEKITDSLYGYPRIYDSGEVYYVEYEESEKQLADFITDDMAEEDAEMTEPEYPDWDDYDTEDEYDEAWEAYDEAYELWWAKTERDEMREDMEDWPIYITEEKLCYYNGKESITISDNLASERYATDKAVVIYSTSGSGGKVKLSECYDIWDAEWQVEQKQDEGGEYFMAQGGESFALGIENVESTAMNADGTLVYYTTNIEEEGTDAELYCMKIANGKVKENALYDEEVYAWYLRILPNGSVVYFKDMEEGVGELFVNGEHLDYDVSAYEGVSYYEQLDQLVYYVDFSDEDIRGTLKLSGGKKPTKVGDDVAQYEILPDGRILILRDYDAEDGYGELYIVDGEDSERIDSEVNAIIPIGIPGSQYTLYTYY